MWGNVVVLVGVGLCLGIKGRGVFVGLRGILRGICGVICYDRVRVIFR